MKKLLIMIFALTAAVCANGQSYSYEQFKEYLSKAQKGDKSAQYNTGLCYHNGWSVATDYEKAAYWYSKAAEQGVPEAQNNLGAMYVAGDGVAKDYEKGAYWYRKSAEQGFMMAQGNLGSLYEEGDGVPEDHAQAAYWHRKAAEQGYMLSQHRLGVCYEDGKGVSQDYRQAAHWYEKAAEQGYILAQNQIAAFYEEGKGVDQDYFKATLWYKKVAGYVLPENPEPWERMAEALFKANAQHTLGTFYENGLGVARNYTTAAMWYMKAAENKYGKSMFRLGHLYENGLGVKKDYSTAVKWYEKSADCGCTEAERMMGDIHFYGRNGTVNYEEAVSYYRKAAYDDDVTAQYRMGQCYEEGKGIPKDMSKAAYWYGLAAEQGHEDSQYRLGKCHEYGTGTSQDYTQAAHWYRKAAEKGNRAADYGMSRIYKADRTIRDVQEYHLLKATKGNAEAQFITGMYYFDGVVVEQNYDEAKTWFDKAAEQAHLGATMMLRRNTNADIWKQVEKDRKRKKIRDEWEYRFWKLGRCLSDFNNPKGYETRSIGVSMGYVSKQWKYKYTDGSKDKGSIFDDKPLNGFQAGIRWNPQFQHGFGLNTGLYYEYYEDKSELQSDKDSWGWFNYYMKMYEHNLHFPIHAEYRMHFSEDIQVFLYGGISLDYALYCKFDYFEDGYTDPYGSIDEDIYATADMLPDVRRFNASWSFGGGVTYRAFQLNAGTRMGFMNMSGSSEYKVTQNNPFQITLSFMF